VASKACVPEAEPVVDWGVGEGERESMPDAMDGLPIDRRTVSRVRSILRRERVRSSCFLLGGQVNMGPYLRGKKKER
jgi:hypothetical protein